MRRLSSGFAFGQVARGDEGPGPVLSLIPGKLGKRLRADRRRFTDQLGDGPADTYVRGRARERRRLRKGPLVLAEPPTVVTERVVYGDLLLEPLVLDPRVHVDPPEAGAVLVWNAHNGKAVRVL